MPPPSGPEQPATRRRRRQWLVALRHRVRHLPSLPAVEADPARVRIDRRPALRRARQVLAVVPPVVQDIRQRVPRLPRRPDDLGVVPRDEHLPAPRRAQPPLDRHRSIQPPRRRDLQPLHPPRERLLAGRLDQQVDVVALDAHVHDADEAEHRRRQHRQPDRVIGPPPAQAADRFGHAQHHVHRRPRRHRRALAHATVERLARRQEVDWLATGVLALAAPLLAVLVAPEVEAGLPCLGLLRRRPRHHLIAPY